MTEDPAARSRTMAAVRSQNTKPEVALRKALWGAGIKGYRLHYPIIGNPDVVFTRPRLVVFVDGCFWHGCPQCFRMPKTHKEYWEPKIAKNVARDEKVNRQLHDEGWQVLRLWEHEIRNELPACIERIAHSLTLARES
jgi:DNA mismatch endonuclease (patch repair protein)